MTFKKKAREMLSRNAFKTTDRSFAKKSEKRVQISKQLNLCAVLNKERWLKSPIVARHNMIPIASDYFSVILDR